MHTSLSSLRTCARMCVKFFSLTKKKNMMQKEHFTGKTEITKFFVIFLPYFIVKFHVNLWLLRKMSKWKERYFVIIVLRFIEFNIEDEYKTFIMGLIQFFGNAALMFIIFRDYHQWLTTAVSKFMCRI